MSESESPQGTEQYDDWIKERETQAKAHLQAAMKNAAEAQLPELIDAYKLIDDLMAVLYGRAEQDPAAEPVHAEIKKLHALAAGKAFFGQQRINLLMKMVQAATEYTYNPDLSEIEHRQYLNPEAWTVRISRGYGGRWYLWRGDPRNPDTVPGHAFFDGTRFVSTDRLSRHELIRYGTDGYDLQATFLEEALTDQLALAKRVAFRHAEGAKRTYRH